VIDIRAGTACVPATVPFFIGHTRRSCMQNPSAQIWGLPIDRRSSPGHTPGGVRAFPESFALDYGIAILYIPGSFAGFGKFLGPKKPEVRVLCY
jgi:hypothetical protein